MDATLHNTIIFMHLQSLYYCSLLSVVWQIGLILIMGISQRHIMSVDSAFMVITLIKEYVCHLLVIH